MAKFHGQIGYVETKETAPGVYSEVATEYNYYGDVLRNIQNWSTNTMSINDNLNINNQFSIVGDWYSYENFKFMKYLIWMNTKWKITNVEVQRPRLIITVGGVYDG